MANQKLTQLLAAGSVIHGLAAEDLLYAVDDPLGTPISKTITALDALGFYNVKGYGAVGDGIVDDTAAIQAAKTALLTSGGGILYIPNGLYKITSTILFDLTIVGLHGIEVRGNSGRSKIYYTPADGTDCFHFLGMTILPTTLHIHDLAFIGAGSASATGNAIRLQRCVNPTQINNITIEHFGGGAGVYIESSWMTTMLSVWMQENKYSVYMIDDPFPGPYGSTLNTIIQGCHLQSSSDHAIHGNCDHLTINTCIIEANEGGIYLVNARHVDISNIWFEQNFGAANNKYDIYAMNSPYLSIRHCNGSAINNVYTDATSHWVINEENEWAMAANDVVINGYGTRNIVSNITGGAWSGLNYETLNGQTAFTADDATPSVLPSGYGYKTYFTANVNPTTITNFDDGYEGQEILIFVNDVNTTFDFSAGSLKGNNGVNYVAVGREIIRAVRNSSGWGPIWYCQIIK